MYRFYIEIPEILDESFEYEVLTPSQIRILETGDFSSDITDKIAIGDVVYNVESALLLPIITGEEETNDAEFSDGGDWYTSGDDIVTFTSGSVDMNLDVPFRTLRTNPYSVPKFENGKTYVVRLTMDSFTFTGVENWSVSVAGFSAGSDLITTSGTISFETTCIDDLANMQVSVSHDSANAILGYFSVREKIGENITVLTLETSSLVIGSSGTFNLYSDWTDIVEPIGFDGFQYTLSRSELYSGVENIFSETDLTWEYPHSKPLIEIFNTEGFDAQLGFKIVDCNGSEIRGVLNFIWYVQNGKDVSIKMEGNPTDRKLLNRIDTVINLDNPIGLEGNGIYLNPYNLKVHQKKFIQQGVFSFSDSNSVVSSETVSASFYYFYVPITATVTEIPGEYNPGGLVLTGAPTPSYYNYKATRAGSYRLRGNISGILTGNRDTGDGAIDINIAILYGANLATPTGVYDLINEVGVHPESGYSFNSDFDITIDLIENETIAIRAFNNPGEYYNLSYNFDNANLDISVVLDYPYSTVRGYDLFDAFRIATEAITGETGIFKSDLLESGCMSNIHFTNGYNIRRLVQKDNVSFNINTSFNNLFSYVNSYTPIGFKFQIEDGVRVLRLEAIQYFYNNNEVIRFDDVDTFRRTVATNKLYNEIEIGYDKYSDQTLNGLDEFNTKHTYAIALKNIRQKKTLINPAITSGFVIESGRRIQFDTNPSQDWKYDSNNFLIQKNRVQVTSNLYGDGYAAYPPGYVSERNELIEASNLFSPETSYNLKFSPARAMINWYPVISISGDTLKFQSGDVNIQLITKDNSVCSNYFGYLTENIDINGDNIFGNKIHQSNYIDFEYPIDIDTFNSISEYSNTLFSISYCDIEYKGYLIEAKFQPLAQSGSLGIFKLVEAGQCVPGAFSDGFSDGFQIGTC